MFKINKLRKEVNQLSIEVRSLQNRIWILENPPIYTTGQKVFITDNIEIEILGIDPNRIKCGRSYLVRINNNIESYAEGDINWEESENLKIQRKHKI
jgi:hypothetical protein